MPSIRRRRYARSASEGPQARAPELRAPGGKLTFNSQLRTVLRDARVLARYDAIQYVNIFENRGDDSSSWSVTLDVKGQLRDIRIGTFRIDADASIMAACVGDIVGKRVRKL